MNKVRDIFKKTCVSLAIAFGVFTLLFTSACGSVGDMLKSKKTYYEATVEFYVRPKKEGVDEQYEVYGEYSQNVMNNMIKLLNSEMFTEELMQGMDGVPTLKDENGEITEEYEVWIESAEGKKLFSRIRECVEYSAELEKSDPKDQAEKARGFIYVVISVPESIGRAFAENLLPVVSEKTVYFVEQNMIVPSGYDGTLCQKLSRLDEITEVKK